MLSHLRWDEIRRNELRRFSAIREILYIFWNGRAYKMSQLIKTLFHKLERFIAQGEKRYNSETV